MWLVFGFQGQNEKKRAYFKMAYFFHFELIFMVAWGV